MVNLFTHSDLDGIGCAILAKIAFGEDVGVTYCNYDDVNSLISDFIDTELSPNDMCHITDISVSDEVAEKINKNSTQFYLLDHHPTALGLNRYEFCTVIIEDKNTGFKTSATEMYYKWLIENGYLYEDEQVQSFVELVRNYDTWRWSILGNDGIICKQVNDLYYLYGKDKFTTWVISEIHDKVFPRLYAVDELVLNMRQKEINEYVEIKDNQIITLVLHGYQCGVVFAERFFNELGNRLCANHPELDFIAMIDMGVGTVSYRTLKDNVNLGRDIAKLYGGGGHYKAAGSQFSNTIKRKVLNEIIG